MQEFEFDGHTVVIDTVKYDDNSKLEIIVTDANGHKYYPPISPYDENPKESVQMWIKLNKPGRYPVLNDRNQATNNWTNDDLKAVMSLQVVAENNGVPLEEIEAKTPEEYMIMWQGKTTEEQASIRKTATALADQYSLQVAMQRLLGLSN